MRTASLGNEKVQCRRNVAQQRSPRNFPVHMSCTSLNRVVHIRCVRYFKLGIAIVMRRAWQRRGMTKTGTISRFPAT